MRGTGQPLCSQTRMPAPTALELWLLLQLSSLLRAPYVRMLSTLRSGLLGSSFAQSPLLRLRNLNVPG